MGELETSPYEAVIGLEIHAELATRTKLFCGCKAIFGDPPNTRTCPVCLGLPGVLPVLNKRAFELGLRVALALNCRIPQMIRFDRKNYYYPDLPKNYQISQLYTNLGTEGYVEIILDGRSKRIGIHNVHLEEDAGKLLHSEEAGADFSLVDLNRAGVPLVEIVSMPDMNTVAEVDAYMKAIRSILRYTRASDCKMEQGAMRLEPSISLREKGKQGLGSRVEIKNLNSFKVVLAVLREEMKRQSEVLLSGGNVTMETRLWDDQAETTVRMRGKEVASDYRYFPEPDLVPFEITKELLAEVRAGMPELGQERLKRLMERYRLPEYDARILLADPARADYFEEAVREYDSPKTISNWLMGDVARIEREKDVSVYETCIPPHFAELVRLADSGAVTGPVAKEVLEDMFVLPRTSPRDIIERKGLARIDDRSAIEDMVKKVVASNPKAVSDFQKGKDTAIKFLIGQAMRESRGRASPSLVEELLRKAVKAS